MQRSHTNDITAAEVDVLLLKARGVGVDKVGLGKHLQPGALETI